MNEQRSDEKPLFQVRRGHALPLGVSKTEKGINFSICVPKQASCRLLLYRHGRSIPEASVELDGQFAQGTVRAVELEGFQQKNIEYSYEIDGRAVIDPYALRLYGTEKYGSRSGDVHCGFDCKSYDWEGDAPLKLPLSQVVAYNLHVRGFTKDASSKVKHRGTFAGIIEKLPYLTDLGINQIELMPAYEFCEIINSQIPSFAADWPYLPKKPAAQEKEAPDAGCALQADECISQSPVRLNYWGYGAAYYFAPKASYAAGGDACVEFKNLVKACHRAGVEVVLEFFFPRETNAQLITDCLRYWAMEYHVDGFHLTADGFSAGTLAMDPILADTKIYAGDFGSLPGDADAAHLARYQDGFSNSMRRMLKGDEDQLNGFLYHLCEHPTDTGIIHYMTSHNGFTLYDLVSYDQKHNEDNGENNQDGCDFNYSWNCGQEGKSRKRRVMALRKKQMKNAFAMLLFSQGTPMLLAGDECGNSQEGNNNPYCHDSKLTWVQWNSGIARELQPFVRDLIALRRRYPVLRSEKPLKTMDVTGSGFPDVSFHSDKAWYLEKEPYIRHVGVMYADSESGQFLYAAFNFHWMEQEFALPYLPKGYVWQALLNTDCTEETASEPETALPDQRKLMLQGRTVMLLLGVCKT